jgi:uncharacterized membrane protein
MLSGMNYKLNTRFKRARTVSLVLLFFLGLSALPAAIFMLMDPSGSEMGLPAEMLDQTPFDSFLIPAILLGLFNGILSLLFAILVIKKHPQQAWMVMFQGSVLMIWLTVEVLMGLYYPALTLPYYLVATLLLACGLLMKLSKSGLS